MSEVTTFQGTVEPSRFPWVLRHIFLDRSTGTLHLEGPDEELDLLFNEGELTIARSTTEGQRLGERLIRRGLISQNELEQALESRAVHPNERIGAALVRTHALSRAVLFEELTAHVREIIFAAFEWTSANYSFEASSEPIDPDVELGLSTAAIIVEAIRRMPADDRFVEALGEDSRLLAVSDDPFSRYDVLRLRPEEAYVLSLCDGHTSIRDVLRAAGPDRQENARSLFALVSCGLLKIAPAAEPVATARKVEPPSRPERESTPTYSPDVQEQRRRIDDLMGRVDFLSSRELLGLPDGPLTPEQIDEAFQARTRQFHPELRKRPEFSDLWHELESLYVAVSQAHRRLLQEDRAARIARAETARLTPVPEKPIANPEIRARIARENYRAAKKKFEDGDSYGAIVLLEESVRIAPYSAEYQFWLGRALTRNPKWRERALKHLESALSISPERTDVAFEMATLLLGLGRLAQAREIAHALVQRHPDDPRYLELAGRCDQAQASTPAEADSGEALSASLWRRLFSRG